MQPAAPEISICPGCGRALEETHAGGLGCMPCLLRVGIGGEDDVSQDSSSNAFERDENFGVYEIERREDGSLYELGHGAMGTTYRAIDTSLQRKVALKIIKIDVATRSAEVRERFLREARAAAALRHENIATVFQFGIREETGQCFYAMELIEGETLEERVRRAGPLDVRTTIDIARQVAAALIAAEKRGLIHRDLKPANLMLVNADDETVAASLRRGVGRKEEKLTVKIIDFGLAKTLNAPVDPARLTHDGFVGTPSFASPEQFEHSTLDVRSDIYSLGVTLWFALTGETPFGGHSVEEIRRAQQSNALPIEQLKAAHVPSRLRLLLKSMLALEPAARPGTRDLAAQLRRCAAQAGSERRTRFALAAAAILILGGSAFFVFHSLRTGHPPAHSSGVAGRPVATAQDSAPNLTAPEKSIAVLPFENLSHDPDNAFFTDGVQDQILTNLAQIADLKVISRTSVMQYKSGAPRNLREIGQQLGVGRVVEGSVQRAGNRVRVNAQLIDARNHAHLWAQTYDRDLADVFAIQSEIANAIADQLQARLSPDEKAAIEKPPTADLAAFDLYTRAKTLLLTTAFTSAGEQNLRQAVELLNEAATRDPAFFEAYCQLAFAHGRLYSLGLDHTASRLASAEAALQAAIRLRPDAGETHLARANYLYYGPRDYAGALAELENARRSLPNHPRLSELTGYILRRRGQQEEGLRNLEKAIELDPRNYFIMQQIALSYQFLRRYPEEAAILDRALTIIPKDAATKVNRALVDFYWKADTKPLHKAIDSILAADPGTISEVADSWFVCALAEHDRVAAERALVALGDNPWWVDAAVILRRSLGEGLLARVMKDEAKTRAAFGKARAEQEKTVQAQPDYGPALCVLGLIDAALGRKEAALEEARRAIELLPVEKDSVNGSRMLVYFAIIAAWAGEKDLALQQLELGARAPTPSQALNYGALKLLPFWDPLRGDPRFEKIVASLAPDTTAKSAPDKSIAVLPFADLSPARDQEYFCDGIQEEILTRLSKIADLKVISRTSTQRYKDAPENLPEIAKQLGVAHILEGTVQKVDDQMRVTVQLIKAENDSYLWSEKYDRKLTDIFAVESEIATNIAAVLQAKLTGAEQRAIATRPTENTEAHQLYLKGIYFWNKRTAPDLRTAIEYFKGAIGKDANYALAYAGLADAYTILSVLRGEGPTVTVSEAKAAARKALQLDDTLPEAHNSLGLVLAYYEFDFAQSKKEFERAIELNPNYADAHHQFGNVNLIKVGEFDRAIAEGSRAVELDPLSLIINADLGQTYLMARRYDEAIEQNRKTLVLDPRFYIAHWNLGEALQMKGHLREAIAEYEKTVQLTDDPRALAMLAQGYAKIGETDKARKVLSQLEQMAAHRYVGAFSFALVHLGLGENEKALEEIERACREPPDPDVINLKIEPVLDPLRGDPRFEALVQKLLAKNSGAPSSELPAKSIAVLPFDNLSRDPDNAFFADGVHDDILTKLAKVADLKVISRTSVMQYRGKHDLRQIGAALGVSHFLEGTVRRSDGKVHINAQLIDARTNTHVWAEEYDRNLNDVFVIESDVAQSVASRLAAKVSARETLAMQERPTSDLVAYDLYTRAKNLVLAAAGRSTGRTDLVQAIDLLNQATARDPSFLQAYCQLASAHGHLYSLGLDRTSARLELANAAIQAAYGLRPEAGEVHLARAENLYRGYLDYNGALAELKVARHSLPNDPRILQLTAFILRRQGHWDEATQDLERALELDPRSTYTLQQMAWQYMFLRRYAEVKPLLTRVLAIEPKRSDIEVFLASVDFHWKADTKPFHQMVDSTQTTNPSAVSSVAEAWLTCALAERDQSAVANAMAASGEDVFGDDTVQFGRKFIEGVVARMMNNEGKAQAAFTAARSEQKKPVGTGPDEAGALCVLGLIDAALGQKKEALREGRRAVELVPLEKDAIVGTRMLAYSAMIAAWAGDKDLACEQLASAIRHPTSPSYGDLKLLPWWDPLRGDPRFEQIVTSLAPK
jgi:TolB-like protein/Tfp pilus assembly protein PilF/tRNA A-37 threonylcarbamoyl transferase component Bud32